MMTLPMFAPDTGTAVFWRSVAPHYGKRSVIGAMRAFAAQHGLAVMHCHDDSALIVTAEGRERRVSAGAVIWRKES